VPRVSARILVRPPVPVKVAPFWYALSEADRQRCLMDEHIRIGREGVPRAIKEPTRLLVRDRRPGVHALVSSATEPATFMHLMLRPA